MTIQQNPSRSPYHLRDADSIQTLCKQLASVFERTPELDTLALDINGLPPELHRQAEQQGLIRQQSRQWFAFRADVFQHPQSGLTSEAFPHFPYQHTVTHNIGHPRRPPKPVGLLYRRFISTLNGCFNLYALNHEQHFGLFHEWMNRPRVNHFWELAGDADTHREYLNKLQNDAHTYPLIGCIDNTPFAYFELYWTKEDRISAYYPAHDYDRGLHILVGDENFLGERYFPVWVSGLMHYAFISEPRCQRLLGEPRVDNRRFIDKLNDFGWVKHKEFDFPHKRSALLVSERERFFNTVI